MNKIKQGNLQRRMGNVVQGWLVKLGGLALSGLLLVAVMAPTPAKADANSTMTQLEYIKWLVQLSDQTHLFSASSTAGDYVQWATENNMKPKNGWQPTATLTREVLAQTLAQFYGIAVKKDTDYVRALEREGIVLPNEAAVTRGGFVSVIDEWGFQSITASKAKKKKTILCPAKTPGKPPKLKSKCTPPKNPPKPPKPPTKPKTPKPPKHK